jgi:hypothetical protein
MIVRDAVGRGAVRILGHRALRDDALRERRRLLKKRRCRDHDDGDKGMGYQGS